MLDRLPYEVLEPIVFWAANDSYDCCSPSILPAIFALNSTIRNGLLGDPNTHPPAKNNALLARLFECHFDKGAFERRCHVTLKNPDLATEYKKRICVLRDIRRNEYSFEDLWTVLLMIYEDDGNNMRQLMDANVEHWATGILIQTRLELDREGWPVENEYLQLSAAILSLVSTTESVARESSETRLQILDTLHPFLFASHRYSASHIPLSQHYVNEAHGLAPVNSSLLVAIGSMFVHRPRAVSHFGHALTLVCPRIVESALCATNLRMERVDNPISSRLPEDRAAADAQGTAGPTQADYRENNYHRRQALGSEVPHAGSTKERENRACLQDPLTGSMRFDVDFYRLMYGLDALKMQPLTDYLIDKTWFNTVYIPGSLTGKWFGRLQIPRWDAFMHMLQSHPAPLPGADGYELFDVVMHISLHEHIATDFLQHIGCGTEESGDGMANAWLPDGIDPSRGIGVYQTPTELVLRCPYEDVPEWEMKHYLTYHDGMEIPQSAVMRPPPERIEERREEQQQDGSLPDAEPHIPEDVMMDFQDEHIRNGGENMVEFRMGDSSPCVDVVLTGETDYRHSRAWGAYTVYGRVRRNDGLIMLVRVPVNEQIGQGRWIFSGYLRASTTIVGQWRETGTAMDASGYAGPFMLTKIGDSWGLPPYHLPPSGQA